MSSLRKIAEAKKERIRAAADRQIAEIDSDLENLEQLAAKYGLSVVEAAPVNENEPEPTAAELEPEAAPPQSAANGSNGLHMTEDNALALIANALAALDRNASVSRRARAAAKAYIRAKNRSVPLAQLGDALTASGVQFGSRGVLSAMLGQDPELRSISRSQGWWFANEPQPSIPRRLLS